MPKTKATSILIEGIDFPQPYKMKKKRFVLMYGPKLGDKTDDVFEQLTKKK